MLAASLPALCLRRRGHRAEAGEGRPASPPRPQSPAGSCNQQLVVVHPLCNSQSHQPAAPRPPQPQPQPGQAQVSGAPKPENSGGPLLSNCVVPLEQLGQCLIESSQAGAASRSSSDKETAPPACPLLLPAGQQSNLCWEEKTWPGCAQVFPLGGARTKK